jgi:hypothetical protein
MYQLKVDAFVIDVKKLDTGEYEFATTYKYVDYWGKSFLKLLNFVDDFGSYLENTKFAVDEFKTHLILCCPVPFSTKCKLVQLNKPEATEYEELKIMIRQQNDIIEDLSRRLKAVEEKSYETLDFVYGVDGWYFDIKNYKKKPGANMANVEFLMSVLNDRIADPVSVTGFKLNHLSDLNKFLEAMDNSTLIAAGGHQGYISPQLLVLLSHIHETERLEDPVIKSKYLLEKYHIICSKQVLPYDFREYFRSSGVIYDTTGYWSHCIDGLSWLASSTKEHPMRVLTDTFKLKKVVAIEFEIPKETIRYVRIPKKLKNGTFEVDEVSINSEFKKIIKKHGHPTKNMRISNHQDSMAATYIMY